jgi:hypothetical protein
MGPLYPRERPGTHCIGGWVGPRAGLDGCGISRPTPPIPGIRFPDRSAHSESLYRLSYPGPYPKLGGLEINKVTQFLAEEDFVNWCGENTNTTKESREKIPSGPSSRSRVTEDS